MELFELIMQRQAVRQYSDKPLNEKAIETILKAGQAAPSPLNSQPWHFTLVRDKKNLKALAEKARHASFLAQAPLLIIVSVNTKPEIDEWLIQHNQHLYSGAAALQNMWLTACSLGIGGCWVTLDEWLTKKLILIPEEQTIIGGLSLGHLAEKPKTHEEKNR